jgi:hypothetical protein
LSFVSRHFVSPVVSGAMESATEVLDHFLDRVLKGERSD